MMDKVVSHDESLRTTLGELGFSPGDVENSRVRVLHHAAPESAAMAATYQFVNERLEELVTCSDMHIRHVTGEARALLDPAHRRVLRRTAARGESANLLCHFTFDHAPTAVQFVKEQHGHWKCETWVDIIDLLNLAAAEEVCIRVLQDAEPIHFSLFGDRFVLLQGKHTHPNPEKPVWFLDSPPLVKHLVPRVAALWGSALPIPVFTFDDALNQLHAYETVAVAVALSRGRSKLSAEAEGLDDSQVRDALALLAAFGFVEDKGEVERQCELTMQGMAWVAHLLG